MDVMWPRVAGLDVHKDTVMAAVRAPGQRQECRARQGVLDLYW